MARCLGVLIAATAMLAAACQSAPRALPTTKPEPTPSPTIQAAKPAAEKATAEKPAPPPEPTVAAPKPDPSPPPVALYVVNTAPDGLSLRPSPGAPDRIKVWPDGTRLEGTGPEQQAAGRGWRPVRDPDGNQGWAAAEFLSQSPPAAAAPKPAGPEKPQPAPSGAQPTPSAPAAPAAAPKPPQTPPVVQKPAGNCHPSYPDFCIPPPPPDLNCNSPALGGRKRFTVRQPDPHGFDRDRDGVGCES